MQLSQKLKILMDFFLHFQNLYYILNIFKKAMTIIADVFSQLPAPKTCLDKCLTSRVLEDPWTDNMANVWKHCCNLKDSTFTVFINHSGANYVRKSLF